MLEEGRKLLGFSTSVLGIPVGQFEFVEGPALDGFNVDGVQLIGIKDDGMSLLGEGEDGNMDGKFVSSAWLGITELGETVGTAVDG